MIYIAAEPVRPDDLEVFVGDEAELAEVRWVSLAEADELMAEYGMFPAVHEHLERELGEALIMARRSRGDGSVFYDASRGCWVGSVDIGRDPETGRRRRRKVSAPTKTECRAELESCARSSARPGRSAAGTSPWRASSGTCWRTRRRSGRRRQRSR